MSSPAETLSEIRKKTDLLLRLRAKRDAGQSKTMGAALALQKVERELKQLRADLPPLQLIT